MRNNLHDLRKQKKYTQEELAKEILVKDEVYIIVNLNDGEGYATAYGCDLTYDYVKINGDYRT